jgi:hypothetical protein
MVDWSAFAGAAPEMAANGRRLFERTLFEFSIEHAVFGARSKPHDWPPVYTSWRSDG